MTRNLAIESIQKAIPNHWRVDPFRRHATLLEETNSSRSMRLLSLRSSDGLVAPRTEDGGLGRQAPSEGTIERYWIANPGNLIVNPMWLIGGGVGVAGVDGAVSPDYRVYKLGSELHPRYMHHLLRSRPYMDQYRLYVRAETTFDRRVSKADFHSMPILIPPISEQQQIATYLDFELARIETMVKLRKRQLACLFEGYSAAISEFVTPGISQPTSRSVLWPWLPESMKVARLGYFARVQSGVTVHNARTATLDDIMLPYLRVANVQGERVDLAEVKEISIPREMARRSRLHFGDVVMTEANGNPDNLGRGALWRDEIPGMVHQNHVFAIRTNPELLLPEYLVALLASQHGRGYFRFTSTQVGIATTSSSKVLDFPIPAVGVVEQRKAIAGCDRVREIVNSTVGVIGKQIELLIERRNALSVAVVTGQFDVSSASGRGVDVS